MTFIPIRGRYVSKAMQALFPVEGEYRLQCSDEMRRVFSKERKHELWHDAWYALMESQHELGLPIEARELEAFARVRGRIDFDRAARYERELRHDVKAFLQELHDQVRENGYTGPFRPHLGATSMLPCDNGELIQLREGLDTIIGGVEELARAAPRRFDTPLDELRRQRANLRARGAKGTTGTQASYLELFGSDDAVTQLDHLVAEKLGFDGAYEITGQTYPRIVDVKVLGALGTLAASLYAIAPGQLRGHAKSIMARSQQAAQMASVQWHERSLDDSAERRIMLSDAFYETDYLLNELLSRHFSTEWRSFFGTIPHGLDASSQEALELLARKTAAAAERIQGFAAEHARTPCAGFTHGQFAQPTTYGKRFALWAYNYALALEDIEGLESPIGDQRTLDALMRSRVHQVAAAAGKAAVDIRLLQHDGELTEPFGREQVGSSAMPFKRNPMKSERMSGLARNAIHATEVGYALMSADAVLELSLKIFSGEDEKQHGLRVNEPVVQRRLMEYMPFFITENIMMEAAREGGDREELHKAIRDAAMAVHEQMLRGGENDMLDRLRDLGLPVPESLDPLTSVGRSAEQVAEFGERVILPIRQRYVDGVEGSVQEGYQ